MRELKKDGPFTVYITDNNNKVVGYREDVFGIQNGKVVCFTNLFAKTKPVVEEKIHNLLLGTTENNGDYPANGDNPTDEQDTEGKGTAEAEQEAESEGTGEATPEADSEPDSEQGSETGSEAEAEQETDSEAEAENEGTAEAEAKQEAEQGNKTEQEAEAQQDSEAEAEMEQEQEQEQETNGEAEPEPQESKIEQYDEILTYIKNGMPVYMYGPAGTGKSYTAKQIANELGLDFYFTNCVTEEHKLTGFINAYGKYQETAFYKAMKYGGLFFLDEMDGSLPEALINLNSALADGYFQFPNEYVECHPNFRVIAAGNTAGQGADDEYTGRYQLDASSLNRFKKVAVDYESSVENLLSNNNQQLIDFAHEIRQESKKAGISLIFSYRDIRDISKLEKSLGKEKILQSTVFYNLSVDALQMLHNAIEHSNTYAKALKRIINKKTA